MVEPLHSAMLLWTAAGLVVGVAIGLVAGWPRVRRLRRQAEKLEADQERATTQAREQLRMIARMKGEQDAMASLARRLPSVVRELNRSDIDPRLVPKIITNLAWATFDPDQVALFLVRSPGHEGKHPTELILVEYRGSGRLPEHLTRIGVGAGRIGWVAENPVEMAAEDWLNPSRTDGRPVAENDPALALDLVGPLVHHSHAGEQVLGVLTIGAPKTRTGDDKLMLQMVTNLGSIALMNAVNLSRLREQAHHDGLTGLLNKKEFMKRLGLLIHAAESEATSLGVFIFDIDFFKRYNDSHGHLAGDELLKTISRVLRQNIRPGDLACRYGGEEFVVALPEVTGHVALRVAEKIRHAIESYPFAHAASQPEGRLTISGGVAAFPEDGTNGTELISRADQSLYQAKADGRNRVLRYRGVDIGDAGGDEVGEFGRWSMPKTATES